MYVIRLGSKSKHKRTFAQSIHEPVVICQSRYRVFELEHFELEHLTFIGRTACHLVCLALVDQKTRAERVFIFIFVIFLKGVEG